MAITCVEAFKEHESYAAKGNYGIERFLSNYNLMKLQEIMNPINIKAGHFLFWEGDEAQKLYYVRSGRVKLKKSTTFAPE